MMTRNDFLNILLFFQKIIPLNVKWAVALETPLELIDYDKLPKGIDILTSTNGAQKIEIAIKNFFMNQKSHPLIKGHVDKYEWDYIEVNIMGIKIDIMGDLKEFINGKWEINFNIKHAKIIKENIKGLKIPVLDVNSMARFSALKRECKKFNMECS
jgi:hypothetical protein